MNPETIAARLNAAIFGLKGCGDPSLALALAARVGEMLAAKDAEMVAYAERFEADVRVDSDRAIQWFKERNVLRAEVARLKAWVDDLHSGLYINCVYCGFRYGPGESTPATLPEAGDGKAAAALREHVERCPDHPMSKLKAEVARLRAVEAAAREYMRAARTGDMHWRVLAYNALDNALAPPAPEGT